MNRPSPRLRAAILAALPESWTTARDIAKGLELWSWQAVRTELCLMASAGLVDKRMEQPQVNQLRAFYRRMEAA